MTDPFQNHLLTIFNRFSTRVTSVQEIGVSYITTLANRKTVSSLPKKSQNLPDFVI
jgi:hypothetical protein